MQDGTDAPAPFPTASTPMPDPMMPPSSAGGMPGVDPPSAMCAAPVGAPAPAALLTRAQYNAVVADLLGDTTRPASSFPPENQVDGFNNNLNAHQASPLLVEKYLESAEKLAAAAVASRLETLAPCQAEQSPLTCGKTFTQTFGHQAFRRPLSPLELQIFDGLFERSYAASGYAFAVEMVLNAILQSPQFLYRFDTQLAPPTPEKGAVPLAPHEFASRMAFFLTGSIPDSELMRFTDSNLLELDEDVAQQARRLLATDRAKEMVREFHHQWLKLDSLPGLMRIPTGSNEGMLVGPDLLGSLDHFIDQVYWGSGKVSELFSSKTVFVSPTLAPLYGAVAPSSGFAPIELPDRAGLLTQPAILSLLAHPDQSAPVLRGVFVRQTLMCLDVPQPPPGANTTPPDPDLSGTTRDRFREHTQKEECAGCHSLFDGLGYTLESYDQLGRYRTTEKDLPIDSTGHILGSGALGLDGPLADVQELAEKLRNSQAVRDCMATTWYRYAMGRALTADDSCSVDEVKAAFNQSNGDLRELLVAITLSTGFRYRAAVTETMP
ncbi:MAG: DUF1588 domain-containing protein [Myxococcota bacterium]|nr:DUF1588 domain-containing protein [Myxococcota bacterium]